MASSGVRLHFRMKLAPDGRPDIVAEQRRRNRVYWHAKDFLGWCKECALKYIQTPLFDYDFKLADWISFLRSNVPESMKFAREAWLIASRQSLVCVANRIKFYKVLIKLGYSKDVAIQELIPKCVEMARSQRLICFAHHLESLPRKLTR